MTQMFIQQYNRSKIFRTLTTSTGYREQPEEQFDHPQRSMPYKPLPFYTAVKIPKWYHRHYDIWDSASQLLSFGDFLSCAKNVIYYHYHYLCEMKQIMCFKCCSANNNFFYKCIIFSVILSLWCTYYHIILKL